MKRTYLIITAVLVTAALFLCFDNVFARGGGGRMGGGGIGSLRIGCFRGNRFRLARRGISGCLLWRGRCLRGSCFCRGS